MCKDTKKVYMISVLSNFFRFILHKLKLNIFKLASVSIIRTRFYARNQQYSLKSYKI